MQMCRLFFTAFWNFWRRPITRLFITNHRWVINAQTGPGFLAHPVYCILSLHHCLNLLPCGE